ncbi:MAG: hypothetical protein ABW123_04590 [Cystobacter sp.]
MAGETKSEYDSKELSEIRKEVIEARNLVIKTDNLLKNLHAEVKSIGKRHEDLQKRQWISSGVAYVLFAALCVGGAVMVISARSSGASAERERLEKTVTELTAQLDKQRADQTAVQTAQRSANEVFRLMTNLPGDERLKGVDELVKLDTSRLTPLERAALNTQAVLLRREIGDAAFERGKVAFRRNDMKSTIEEVSRFVAMNPPQEQLLDASFFLGVAYNNERKHELAVPQLARFVAGDKKSKTRDYAMLLLSHSYQETGDLDKAMATVQEALSTYPASEFLPQMRSRTNSIRRQRAGGAEAAAAPAAAAAPKPLVPVTVPLPAAPAPAQ